MVSPSGRGRSHEGLQNIYPQKSQKDKRKETKKMRRRLKTEEKEKKHTQSKEIKKHKF